MSTQNPMIEKLRKLIAHERSARSIGNLAEAEAFAARIQDILTAHKLSMSEVEFQEREEGEPIDWERVDGDDIETERHLTTGYWRVLIAQTIAKINSCVVVNAGGTRGKSFFFVGRTSDRQLAKILYVYLVELGEELCVKSARENQASQKEKFNAANSLSSARTPDWAKAAFRKWIKYYQKSWKVGFTKAIVARLEARYEETLRAQAAVSANAIVHIKRDALAIREFLKDKTKTSKSTIRGKIFNSDGFKSGQRTGNAVNLSPNTFTGTTGRTSRLLGA